MERHVMMKLRVAVATDFADQFDAKKIGVIYFHLSSSGSIESKPNYFNEKTDMKNFKQLYANKQIYVAVNPLDEVAVLEEWEEDEDIKSA